MTDLSALNGVTVVFDLDGTLVDTAPDLVATLNVLLEQEGVAPLPPAQARDMIGQGARALIAKGFAAAGAALDPAALDGLFERFIAHYREHIADESLPFPGLVAALDTLHAAGAILCVCTNKRTDLSFALLKALDLDAYFKSVVGADAARAPKPDPGHLLTAIEAAGGDPGARDHGRRLGLRRRSRESRRDAADPGHLRLYRDARDAARRRCLDRRVRPAPERLRQAHRLVRDALKLYTPALPPLGDGRVAQRESVRFTREMS